MSKNKKGEAISADDVISVDDGLEIIERGLAVMTEFLWDAAVCRKYHNHAKDKKQK